VSVKIAYQMHGITYRQFDHWVTRGWIRPTNSGGSGHDRVFSMDEVRIFRIMATLTTLGFRPAHAAELARNTVDLGWRGTLALRDKRVVTTGILSSRVQSPPGESTLGTRAG